MEMSVENLDEVLGEPFDIPYGYTARKVEESYRGMMAVIDMAAKSGRVLCRETSFYSPNTRTENDPHCIWQYSAHFLRLVRFSTVYAVFRHGEFVAAICEESIPSLINLLPNSTLDMQRDELDIIEESLSLALPETPRYSEKDLRKLMRSGDSEDFMRLVIAEGDVHSYERAEYARRLDWLSRNAGADVRLAIANNRMANADTIDRMMRNDPDWRVRRAAFWRYGYFEPHNDDLYRLASRDPSPEVRLVMPLLFTLKESRIARIFLDDPDEIVRCAVAFNYIGNDAGIYAKLAESGRNERKYLLNKAGSLPDGVLKYMLELSEDPDERADIMVAMLDMN